MKKFSLFLILSCLFISLTFADSSYVVQKGDTLYSISKKFQLTVAELRAANNLSDNDVLKAGQKLVIPEADIGTAAALSSSKPAPSTTKVTKTSEYIVQKGDTLYSLSKKNNMTVADLLALNGLDSSSVIKVGQKLKIASSVAPADELKPATPATVAKTEVKKETPVVTEKVPDTRNYGTTVSADSTTKWPVKNPKVTQVKGKISGVQLSAAKDENVVCIHEGTVMYVGVYRGFGQVVFIQSKTGLIYAYTGLGTVNVNKGEYVVTDGKIGSAGVDSISGKSQITFMVFQNGQPIDPGKAPRN